MGPLYKSGKSRHKRILELLIHFLLTSIQQLATVGDRWQLHLNMQRNQTCKFLQTQQYLPLPITFKIPKKIDIQLYTKVINLWSYFNSKLRDWSTRCEMNVFLISVSSDACQEHYLTLVENLSSFYNHTEYLSLHANDKFLSWEKGIMCSKMQNIKWRGQERDSNKISKTAAYHSSQNHYHFGNKGLASWAALTWLVRDSHLHLSFLHLEIRSLPEGVSSLSLNLKNSR